MIIKSINLIQNRGYDSIGLAYLDNYNKKFIVKKKVNNYNDDCIKSTINFLRNNNIITNLKTGNQDNYIFIYSESLVKNLNKLNDYLKENFNIFIVKQNIYNLEINDHCPFETILSIEKLKN